ncbi:phage antirepressor N-terminal domain-containing protein [Chitinimonas sp.]|uniref:phage antirepressor N-terminal domain-containing protein n=1 Tax=Chitinimonas sp. TaxID=1934313 RepID=UPI0035B41C34
MKHVTQHIVIHYAGLDLPVIKNEQGIDCVPVKPIAEIFGLDWVTQHKRMQGNWNARFLGTCIGHMPYAGQQREMLCIRLDRVVAYLQSINPERVRANGNVSGADFLEAKLNEWADALHDYEELGYAANPKTLVANRNSTMRLFMTLCREKRVTELEHDSKALDAMCKQLASELNIPYQLPLSS